MTINSLKEMLKQYRILIYQIKCRGLIWMLLKVIFLSMLCMPIAYLQYVLIQDAAKDIKPKRVLANRNQVTTTTTAQGYLRIAK